MKAKLTPVGTSSPGVRLRVGGIGPGAGGDGVREASAEGGQRQEGCSSQHPPRERGRGRGRGRPGGGQGAGGGQGDREVCPQRAQPCAVGEKVKVRKKL